MSMEFLPKYCPPFDYYFMAATNMVKPIINCHYFIILRQLSRAVTENCPALLHIVPRVNTHDFSRGTPTLCTAYITQCVIFHQI